MPKGQPCDRRLSVGRTNRENLDGSRALRGTGDDEVREQRETRKQTWHFRSSGERACVFGQWFVPDSVEDTLDSVCVILEWGAASAGSLSITPPARHKASSSA